MICCFAVLDQGVLIENPSATSALPGMFTSAAPRITSEPLIGPQRIRHPSIEGRLAGDYESRLFQRSAARRPSRAACGQGPSPDRRTRCRRQRQRLEEATGSDGTGVTADVGLRGRRDSRRARRRLDRSGCRRSRLWVRRRRRCPGRVGCIDGLCPDPVDTRLCCCGLADPAFSSQCGPGPTPRTDERANPPALDGPPSHGLAWSLPAKSQPPDPGGALTRMAWVSRRFRCTFEGS